MQAGSKHAYSMLSSWKLGGEEDEETEGRETVAFQTEWSEKVLWGDGV